MIIKHIVGLLGQDPKIEKTKAGDVCKLSVAANYYANGEKQTEWHNVSVFGKQAEACMKNLVKGQAIAVVGKCTYNTSKDKKYENITALDVHFLSKPDPKSESKGPEFQIPF